jgi:HSP20 family protein
MVIRITGTSRRPEAQLEQNASTAPFRFFEDLFNDWAAKSILAHRRESLRPPVDILEKDNMFFVRTELPGITENDFELKLDGNTLTIKAEKKMESEDSGYNYHQIEGFYGTYTRSFNLPDTVDAEKISASYNNGVLTITIPQKPEMKPRDIKVHHG